MSNEQTITVTAHRSAFTDALACLAASRDDDREPQRYRDDYAASYEELAEALREAEAR